MANQNLSPLLASNIVCSNCGGLCIPEVVVNRLGQVLSVDYEHHNEVKQCHWKFRSKVYASGMMTPMRADGSESQL